MRNVTGDRFKTSAMDLFLGVKRKLKSQNFRFPCLIRHIMTKCDQLRSDLIFRSTLFVHLLKGR